ncbi:MAG TPA: hypothetical protein VM536_01810, partial [Chloroflexia bacterium]|nr:hypothetical protein [Chloroflexia bacterium]
DAQAGAASEPPATAALRNATQHVGAALAHLEAAGLLGGPLADAPEVEAPRALAAAVRCLTREQTPDLPERIAMHVAEGFACYALYPEHYLLSLRASPLWPLAGRETVVIGVRSIGTALGGVVAGALAAGGGQVQAFSVRPGGHPYHRALAWEPWQSVIVRQAGPDAWFAVVDEGPGLSGSSFAAVGEALLDLGVPGRRICFFPAHGHGPGSAADPAVHGVWQQVQVCPPPQDARIPFALPGWPSALHDADRYPLAGAGTWEAAAPFERSAWLLPAHGDNPATLLSFAGLGPHGITQVARARAMAEAGWSAPLGPAADGYLASTWPAPPGASNQAPDSGNPAHLARLGAYLAHATQVYEEPGDPAAVLDTLLDMLYWNTWEAVDEEAAETTRRYAAPAWRHALTESPLVAPPPGLRPDEWHVGADAGLTLALPLGRQHGHPLPARADIAWSLAALVANWDLPPAGTDALLAAFVVSGGDSISPQRRHFYGLAYAAFDAGRAKLAGDSTGDWTAYEAGRARLRAALRQTAPL